MKKKVKDLDVEVGWGKMVKTVEEGYKPLLQIYHLKTSYILQKFV